MTEKSKKQEKAEKPFETRCNLCGCPLVECPKEEGVIRIFDRWYKRDRRRK